MSQTTGIELAVISDSRLQGGLGVSDSSVLATTTPEPQLSITLSRDEVAPSDIEQESGIARILESEDPDDLLTNVSELPPVDRGVRAWAFCACAFVVEVFIFGWFNSYGVFQEYYTSHPPFQNESPAIISVVGTSGFAIQYVEAIFVIAAAQRYPEYAKPAMWVSLLCTVLSLVLSSFATEVWHLILLQGVAYGLSAGACYGPILTWLSQWFVTRRGLAAGLIFCGSGAGGFIVPLVVGALLEKVGFRWTLRIWGLVLGAVCSVALLGVNPRIPAHKPTVQRPRPTWIPTDISFIKNPLLLLYVVTTIVQALAYFPVSIFIPTYTASLSSSALSSTISLALFNLTSLLGYLSLGRLSDIYPYPVIVTIIGVATALATFLLWGFANSLPIVFVFSAIFGALNGGFSAFWPAVATSIAGERSEQASLAIGIFSAVKGVPAVVGPIIAASLHSSSTNSSPGALMQPSTYGSFGFGKVQYFVGSMAIATGLCGLALLVSSPKRLRN